MFGLRLWLRRSSLADLLAGVAGEAKVRVEKARVAVTGAVRDGLAR